MIRLLIIEDDLKIRTLLARDLEFEGYAVHVASDGAQGLETLKRVKPDLVILDVGLPDMSGYDLCAALRREGSDVPILMLTARGREIDKVTGLDQGADDYVTKPFGAMELRSRIQALLRRRQRERARVDAITFNGIEVDFRKMTCTRDGSAVALTAKEFQILELLVRHRGEVVTRKQFLEDVWGYDEMPSTRTVDTQILTLRQKLGSKDPEQFIATVHGAGYKFVA